MLIIALSATVKSMLQTCRYDQSTQQNDLQFLHGTVTLGVFKNVKGVLFTTLFTEDVVYHIVYKGCSQHVDVVYHILYKRCSQHCLQGGVLFTTLFTRDVAQ